MNARREQFLRMQREADERRMRVDRELARRRVTTPIHVTIDGRSIAEWARLHRPK